MSNKCFICKSPVIWGGDADYEDYGIEGVGIVSNHSCSNEDCNADYLVRTGEDE